MSNSKQDKANGAWNRAKGSVKENVGRVIGNPTLEAKGDADQVKGHAQSALGNAKDAIKSGLKNAGAALTKLGKK